MSTMTEISSGCFQEKSLLRIFCQILLPIRLKTLSDHILKEDFINVLQLQGMKIFLFIIRRQNRQRFIRRIFWISMRKMQNLYSDFTGTEEQSTYNLSLETGGKLIDMKKSSIDILCIVTMCDQGG